MAEDRALFVHIMKTGGASFTQHARANLAPEEIWPPPGTGERPGQSSYGDVTALLDLDEAARRRIRFYTGHVPAVVAEMIGATTTLTVLRDPVERTISFLRHASAWHPVQAGRTLTEIYQDHHQYGFFIHDYQVRQFAKREGDDLAHIGFLLIDDERAEQARRRLDQIDLVGIYTEYDDFTRRALSLLGWPVVERPRRNQSNRADDVPIALREQIVHDLAADIAFYDYAVDLVRRRGAEETSAAASAPSGTGRRPWGRRRGSAAR